MKHRILFLFVLLAFVGTNLSAQTVRGSIIGADDKQPVVGANVVEKGTYNGVISDIDGKFSIDLKGKDAILVCSLIGYEDYEYKVVGDKEIIIILQTSAIDLDELVVVGYGTQKKSHLTGSISKVKNESLDQMPVAQAAEALVGKVSGVTIQTTDGSAGAAPTIRVRGIGSITGDSAPLVVIDGIVVEDGFESLDMNDVASIEVLKDAASAAIYGSRASNGVLMVTTKGGDYSDKGVTRKPVVSINTYVGVKYTPNFDDKFTSVSEWEEYVLANNNGEATDRLNYIKQLGTETDWLDVMFDGGLIQNYSMNVGGGSEFSKYYLSVSYLDDEGVLLTDNYKKVNARVKLDTKVADFITLGASINPSYSSKRDFPIGIHDALRQSPWLPIYHDENTIQYVDRDKYPDVQIGDYTFERHFDNYDLYGNGSDVDISNTSNANPYAKVVERDERQYQFKVNSSAYAKIKLAKGITFKSTLGINYSVKQDVEWVGSEAHRNGSSAVESNNDVDIKYHSSSESILTFDRTYGKHKVDAVAGFAMEYWQAKQSDMTGTGYEFDYIRTLNAASEISQATTFTEEEALHSVLSRVNYAYNDKYLFSLSARWDGSSRFGENCRYGFFPAGSFGWRVSEEDFLKDNDVISNLKLRVSYGTTGNKNSIDGKYEHLSRIEPVTAITDGQVTTGFNPANIASPDLKWEKSIEFNAGVNVGLFDNIMTLSLDYYKKRSDDLLLDLPVSGVSGFQEATVNSGEVANSGVEIEISGEILRGNGLTWSSSLNGSFNKNELVDFAGASGMISYVDSKRPSEYIALEGQPISSYYGYVYEKDIPLEYLSNPLYPIGATAQDVYVKDLNEDGIIDEDDRAILGSPYPKFTWGFNNSFKYKNFDLGVTIQGSHGAKVRNMDQEYYENQFSSKMDYTSDFPDADKVIRKVLTSKAVQDASYVALRNVNLGYSFSSALLKRVGFKKARVYASAQNLMYLMSSEYTSFNPEGITDDSSPLRGGYQRGAAPISKAITFGINLDL